VVEGETVASTQPADHLNLLVRGLVRVIRAIDLHRKARDSRKWRVEEEDLHPKKEATGRSLAASPGYCGLLCRRVEQK